MSPQYDWRDLATAAHQPIEHEEIVLRRVMRLLAQCRTPEDIGALIGMNPADVRVLIYGVDEPGAVA